MATGTEPFQFSTGIAEQTTELMTRQMQQAMENYVNWLQNAMSTFPWVNTDLNKKLLHHATQNVIATFVFLQKLGQAKNLEDVTIIQTEFVSAQLASFNEQANIIREICTKTAAAATKTPFGMST
jgi:hypothetical protein